MAKLNQKGFAALELILTVVIVAMVASIGYYVYSANHKTNNTLNAAAKDAQSSPAKVTKKTVTGTNYQFKELNVQFKLPASLEGMTYEAKQVSDDNGQQVTMLYLADPSLTPILNKCVTSTGGTNTSDVAPSFAAIDKIAGTYDSDKEQGESSLLKQFATSHILVGYPNGAICGSDDQTLNDQWKVALAASQKAFADSFKSSATEY